MRFGSVGGGGRYDGLVSRFRGEPVPATGFSIGVSRLMTALKNLGKLDTSDVLAPVVVLVLDKDTDSLGRYQKMVSALRQADIRAELYLGGAGMKAQMKYADRRGAPCVVIQGGDERAKGEVQIKDLIEGARLSAEITDNTAWREGRPAQVTVPESELVAAVQRILAAQAEERSRGKYGVRVRSAPSACRTLPRRGEMAASVSRIASVAGVAQRRCGRSPPLRGRRPARQRGVERLRVERAHDLPLPRHRPRHPEALRRAWRRHRRRAGASSRPTRSSTWPARICAAASS